MLIAASHCNKLSSVSTMTKYTGCILTRQFIAVTILRDVLFLFLNVFPDPMSLQPFFWTNSSLAETSGLSTFSLM